MKLDDYKNAENPDWYLLDGTNYENSTDLLQTGFLGFCGCGSPEDNLEFVLRGLEHIDTPRPDGYGDVVWKPWLDKWKAQTRDIFENETIAYFFYYWCDKEGLTEHGGSVPGWLTEKGKSLLTLLREWRGYAATDKGEGRT